MKLTNKQLEGLDIILYHLERANDFINKQDVVIGKKRKFCSTDGYTNKDDELAIYTINKEIGSDLCGLIDGITLLKNFKNFYAK